jgi:hypothetical protein
MVTIRKANVAVLGDGRVLRSVWVHKADHGLQVWLSKPDTPPYPEDRFYPWHRVDHVAFPEDETFTPGSF